MTILLITADFDPHLPRILAALRHRRAQSAFLNMNHVYRMGITLRLGRDHPTTGYLKTTDGPLPLDDIRAVWAPSPWPMAPIPGMARRGRLVVMSEWLAALRNLYFLTRDRFWANPIDAEMQVSARIYQMELAKEVGFDIPATLVTTDRQEFREFVAGAPEGAAGKRLGDLVLLRTEPRRGRHPTTLYTRHLTAETLSEKELRSINLCPCHLEEYVPKSTELRVYVLGSRTYAAEILSQEDPQTRIDWRKYPSRRAAGGRLEIDRARWRTRRARIPTELQARVLTLARRLRLQYTAVDLIKTPDGRYVFLEANFGGIYAWIEDFTHLPISAGIADMLVRGANGPRSS